MHNEGKKLIKLVFAWVQKVTHSLPGGFWSKAYITTSEEAYEVANTIPVNRSTKAIPINIHCFLFIFTEIWDNDVHILNSSSESK